MFGKKKTLTPPVDARVDEVYALRRRVEILLYERDRAERAYAELYASWRALSHARDDNAVLIAEYRRRDQEKENAHVEPDEQPDERPTADV